MRNTTILQKRDQDLVAYFNEQYKNLGDGPASAKYTIALTRTAKKFYLGKRRAQDILKGN